MTCWEGSLLPFDGCVRISVRRSDGGVGAQSARATRDRPTTVVVVRPFTPGCPPHAVRFCRSTDGGEWMLGVLFRPPAKNDPTVGCTYGARISSLPVAAERAGASDADTKSAVSKSCGRIFAGLVGLANLFLCVKRGWTVGARMT